VRWIGWFIGVCLLFAGASPRAAHRTTEPPNDELAPLKGIAKLAQRRHDGARPIGRLELEPFVVDDPDDDRASPEARIVAVAAPMHARARITRLPFHARGPPVRLKSSTRLVHFS
jgi:hypothetical protein